MLQKYLGIADWLQPEPVGLFRDLQVLGQLVCGSTRLAEDRAESSERQVTGATDRNAHELPCPGSLEVMMAAADVHQYEAGTFEGRGPRLFRWPAGAGSRHGDIDLDEQLGRGVSRDRDSLFVGGLEVPEDRLSGLSKGLLAGFAKGR